MMPPTPVGLALLLVVALATAGWAATWNTRAGTAFTLLNVATAVFIVAALVGWYAGR
jgi:hypothetical protein